MLIELGGDPRKIGNFCQWGVLIRFEVCWHKIGVRFSKHHHMKIISTKTHGVLDYVVGLLLIASPWLFGFYESGAETWVPVALGAMTLIYSLCTNYERGVVRLISMRVHLLLDLASGFFLAFSPWLFGFSDTVWTPHVVFGVMEMIVVALSASVAGNELSGERERRLRAVH